MEYAVLGVFCAALLLCIGFDVSILFALGFGLLLFLLYGRKKGFSWRALGRMALGGVKTVRGILLALLLVGVLTAFWRAAGTIAVVVAFASRLIRPSAFLLMTFLLNCGVSVVTGTSFGTAATMGVICAGMGSAMNVSPVLTGGAVLSGVYFGDRCSPVSTSALLVAALTGTDIYGNIRRMLRSALAPFLLSCALYFLIGLRTSSSAALPDLQRLFSSEFSLHAIALLPAALILLLAACRVRVRLAMTASIAAAVPLILFLQHGTAAGLLKTAVFGFAPREAALAEMLGGGGLLSMGKVAGIVCLSSSYSELFQRTGLLDGAKGTVASLQRRTNAYFAVLVTSLAAAVVACNQTLTILLTEQLCRDGYPDKERLALDLEDTAVVVAPLIPWSIAGSVPLAAVGAPTASLLASFYLILLPLWRLLPVRKSGGKTAL